MRQQKYYDYDFIRILAIIAVIMIHIAVSPLFSASVGSTAWQVANLIDSVARWCVPVFIMLSGALLLKPRSGPVEFADFYARRLGKVVLPGLAWLGIYLWWYAAVASPLPLGADIIEFLKQLVNGTPIPGHLYFILVIVGLYLITPLLNYLLSGLRLRQIVWLALSVVALTGAINFIEVWWLHGGMTYNLLTYWLPFVGYYLLGYVIHQYRSLLDRARPGAVIVLSAALLAGIAAATTVLASSYGLNTRGFYFYEFINPVIALLSVMVFAWGNMFVRLTGHLGSRLRQKVYRSAAYLSGLTFGVYLSHMLVLFYAWRIMEKVTVKHYWLGVALVFVFTVVVSFAVTALYQYASRAIRQFNIKKYLTKPGAAAVEVAEQLS